MNVCSGMIEIKGTGGSLALIVTGNDAFEKGSSGLTEGEEITFRLYNPATSEISELVADADNGTAFATNEISVFKSLQISAQSFTESAKITIWPNPATDNLKVSVEGIQTSYSVELFDAYGSSVMKHNQLEGISDIDLAAVARGVYFIKVVYQHNTFTQKVIVQ